MTRHYEHLGIFSDLVDEARRQGPLYPSPLPGPQTQALVREALGFCCGPETPTGRPGGTALGARSLAGEELSWSRATGRARTRISSSRPRPQGPLPALVALHDHGGFKYCGKEKIADGSLIAAHCRTCWRATGSSTTAAGPTPTPWHARVSSFWCLTPSCGAAGAFPGDHARGSAQRSGRIAGRLATTRLGSAAGRSPNTTRRRACTNTRYPNTATPWAPAWPAWSVMRTASRSTTSDRGPMCAARGWAAWAFPAAATARRCSTRPMMASLAAVIVGLMSTYEGLLDHNMSHTWMLFPFGWARHGDWPRPGGLPRAVASARAVPSGRRSLHRARHAGRRCPAARSFCRGGPSGCLHRPVLPRPSSLRYRDADCRLGLVARKI